MKYMSHNDIRNTWYRFFESKGHKKVESAPLVPIGDDSLLWINAGVTPLKKYFDGREVPDCRRLVNIQKCIRTNDIDNVGITKRHQTFFEMMGNFSVGDYFKEEALREYAQKCFYIVTVMKNNGIGVGLYKYKVPYESLLNFFNQFRNNKSYGEIIDIERYVPEDLA